MQIESGKRSGWERRKSKEVRGSVAPKSMQHLFVFTFWAAFICIHLCLPFCLPFLMCFAVLKWGWGSSWRGVAVSGVWGEGGVRRVISVRCVTWSLRCVCFAVSFFYYCSQCVREFTLYIPMLRGRRFTFIIYTQAVVVPRVGAGAVRWWWQWLWHPKSVFELRAALW